MMSPKILSVSIALLVVGLGVFFTYVTRQVIERRKPAVFYHLAIAASSCLLLFFLEIIDLFLIRNHIPFTGERFIPFLIATFRFGSWGILSLALGSWCVDWAAYLGSFFFERWKEKFVRAETWILFFPLLVTFAFLALLAFEYLRLQWWVEHPFPLCFALPAVFTFLAALYMERRIPDRKLKGTIYFFIWFVFLGYFISTQLIERFHNTVLRAGVIGLLVLALLAFFRFWISAPFQFSRAWRGIVLGLWIVLFSISNFIPLNNMLILDTFLRSNYLYLATLLFHRLPKIYHISKYDAERDKSQIVVSGHTEKPNLLIITSEALRGDLFREDFDQNIQSEAMPEMARLAQEGTFFFNHRSTSPVTLHSFFMILSGRYLVKLPSYRDAISFFEAAKKAGYRTVLFQPFRKVPKFSGMVSFIDEMHELPITQAMLLGFHSSSEIITQKSMEIISRLDREKTPYLFWVHYVDPHALYNDPEDPIGSRTAWTAEKAREKYLKEVGQVDQHAGRLIDTARHSLSKTPKILFTADHGEEFLDHLNRTHATYLYDESIRVPFLIFDPENPGKRVIHEATAHADIFPTLLDWMGVTIKNYPLDGLSLVPATQGNEFSGHESLFLVSDYRQFVGLLEGKQKLIQYYFHERFPAFELFDLEKDPYESTNLYRNPSQEAIALKEKLAGWMTRSKRLGRT